MVNASRIVENYVQENRFYVVMESQITAYFSECSGLSMDAKPKNFLEGGVNDRERSLISPAKFKPIKLKRGVTDNLLFLQWLAQTQRSQTLVKPAPNSSQGMRRNVNILIFNQAGEIMQNWTLIAAFPIGWKAPSFKAKGKGVALEEITLSYETLEISNTGVSSAVFLKNRNELGDFV
ncbi:phage tail protein [Spirulina subsalsa]|uniref:phage tail protein n=1 Tax=Spirulina subsalsa TaxID=54311 RepID=UPI0004747FCC|nr:phage tail protein [Spirulina subsalsa]